ncbi:hypothetical protein [Pseudorhodobacter aquimaris]|uniref:hypothetical protein n=1 Tax=Pseudorhodobacter aquimaris TaxID=687412 RepID=UPI00067B34A7|nr:hypothetical protein [Pseudorhodobacter aquimaris]
MDYYADMAQKDPENKYIPKAGKKPASSGVPAPVGPRLLIDPVGWRQAEAAIAPQLARTAAALAMLDQRCLTLGAGAAERLALIEVEAMLWVQGVRVRREQIAAYLSGAGGLSDNRAELARASWVYRRLLARPGPLPAIRSFLGLHEVVGAGLPENLSPRPKGAEFDLAAEVFSSGMQEMAGCHPLTQSGYGQALWRLSGVSAPEDLLEPATAAGRIAAAECRALGFAPVAPGGKAWQLSAKPESLGDWLAAVRSGAQSAMMELNRVEAWAASARARTSGMKGTTPAKLIDAIAARPILTTEAAAILTGVSRDSAERGLARLHAMGVVQEITGSKRFRLWVTGAA